MKSIFATFSLLVLFTRLASAQLLYQDSFNYTNGPLVTAAGSPWVNNYQPTNEINVVNGEIVLDQSKQESVRYDFHKDYHTNIYAAFKVRFTALPTGPGNYFAFFRTYNSDALFCRLTGTTNGAAAGRFRLGITMLSGVPAMVARDLSLGTSYTLVLRMSNAQFVSKASLWVDPTTESDAHAFAEYNALGYSIGHFGFKQRAFYEPVGNGMGVLAVDDLKIGFRFFDVLPLVQLTRLESLGAGGVRLNGFGGAGTNYSILASTTANFATWTNLGTAQAATNNVLQFADLAATNFPTRFYRLRAQ
jgi:hypothetical protein